MATPYICPCCFLNRISSLRNTPEASTELVSKYNSDQGGGASENQSAFLNLGMTGIDGKRDRVPTLLSDSTIGGMPTLMSDSTINTYKLNSCNFSEDSDFILPERLTTSTKRPHSQDTFTIGDINVESSILTVMVRENIVAVSQESLNKCDLADQIGNMLQEQKRFMKELNLPIRDSAGFKLMLDEVDEHSSRGDCRIDSPDTFQKISKKQESNTIESMANKIVFYASGDRNNSALERCFGSKPFSKNVSLVPYLKEQIAKPRMYFNDEPVKLSKPFDWVFPRDDADINKDSATDKHVSVKTLFFPEVGMQGSASSMESQGNQSVYITAANSYTDTNCASVMFTVAHGNSAGSLSVNTSGTE